MSKWIGNVVFHQFFSRIRSALACCSAIVAHTCSRTCHTPFWSAHLLQLPWQWERLKAEATKGFGQMAAAKHMWNNYVVQPNLIFFGHESGTVLQQASPWSQGVLKWSGSKPQGSCKSSPPQVFGQLNKQFIGKFRSLWPMMVPPPDQQHVQLMLDIASRLFPRNASYNLNMFFRFSLGLFPGGQSWNQRGSRRHPQGGIFTNNSDHF